jgi:peptide deformylase
MTAYKILRWPDPRLRVKAKELEFTERDERAQEIITRMILTMISNYGVGLAATQVGIDKRIIVMQHQGQPIGLINPEVLEISEEKHTLKEGCLSFPTIFEMIERPKRVVVKALTPSYEFATYEFTGLEATCFLHEQDHLDGKVFVDYLSPIRRALINKKLKKVKIK